MFVIIKHGFDNMENHCPDYEEIIGYIEDETEANEWVKIHNESDNKYKGWSGKMYPYYTKKEINKIK